MIKLRWMRMLPTPLLVWVARLVGVVAMGCGVDRPVVRTCQTMTSSLGLSAPSQLGVSGSELKELATGDYTVTATGLDGQSFALDLNVASSAERAEQRVGQNEPPSMACPSVLRVEADFQLASDVLAGSWSGSIVAMKVTSGSGKPTIRAEASVPREHFTLLPSASKAARFSFSTTVASEAIAGTLAEELEPGGPDDNHETQSPLILASW